MEANVSRKAEKGGDPVGDLEIGQDNPEVNMKASRSIKEKKLIESCGDF